MKLRRQLMLRARRMNSEESPDKRKRIRIERLWEPILSSTKRDTQLVNKRMVSLLSLARPISLRKDLLKT